MNIIKFFIITIVLSFSFVLKAENSQPFNAVQNLFAAMSAFDFQRMRDVVTDDFQLLEHGEDWSIERLIKAIDPKGNPYVRKNYFKIIREVPKDGVVWVSYWNKATFQSGKKSEDKSAQKINVAIWLESAVMVKENNVWKLQMLHSTKINNDKLPKDVVFEEYVD